MLSIKSIECSGRFGHILISWTFKPKSMSFEAAAIQESASLIEFKASISGHSISLFLIELAISTGVVRESSNCIDSGLYCAEKDTALLIISGSLISNFCKITFNVSQCNG